MFIAYVRSGICIYRYVFSPTPNCCLLPTGKCDSTTAPPPFHPYPLHPHVQNRNAKRYVDCASNSILQTVAMAHPATPASNIFEMARLIESNITVTMADWLMRKNPPT